MSHLQDGQQKVLWHMSSLPLAGGCCSCASIQMAFTCFSSPLPGAALSSRAGKLWELAHSHTCSGKLLSGTALQCGSLGTQLVCLSHLGFAQLLEEIDLDKTTNLLLTTLEY